MLIYVFPLFAQTHVCSEREMRNRLFWCLYSYDRGLSIAYGRPPVLHDGHIDVPEPANINNADLTPAGIRNVRPIEIVTDSTYLLVNIR